MRVFIVVDSPSHEQSTILAVCSTWDIAKEYRAKNCKDIPYDDIDIEEWIIDYEA